ncbi:MAG: hypothetical protein KKD25_03945 [Gammaproteobacteria bacterium]|jgi:hypothetical protein|nr:hypothetical protein [Gammaproteobacteria bacterium]MBU0771641.1 hypothetical protein [Gammaproteobacteria bacterium]MBU0856914.1 hypothetical protein [Gammaproteobacteria bacterium]MBU1848215.1 hypothetical protein [Gammaproteobacteria bacterium]
MTPRRNTRPRWTPHTTRTLLAAALLGGGGAQAQTTLTGPGDSSLTLGLWLRTSYVIEETERPDGRRAHDSGVTMDSVRLLSSAKFTRRLGATLTFERPPSADMQLLDAILQFEAADGVNLWLGRLVPPTDRSNMAGNQFANVWGYPRVSLYPNAFTGRDDGVLLWGNLLGDRLLYGIGAFEGKNRGRGLSNDSNDPLFAARVAWSFLDPEPGYYGTSTYYGQKEVFTLGAAWLSQKNGVGLAGARGDYRAWNIDALFEHRLPGAGVVTVEGAWYDYDTDGVADVAPADPLCARVGNCGGAVPATAFLLTAAYLIPARTGIGQLQPYVRLQRFEPDAGARVDQRDAGVNYVISGHNARITAVYSSIDTDGARRLDRVVLGLQLLY